MKLHELYFIIPKEQIERMTVEASGDIDFEFLGFTKQYKALAQIIPRTRTIIDLGCAYAAQCFYFTDFVQYIGVDICDAERRFHAENTVHMQMDIRDFIRDIVPAMDLSTTFAICNYVPDDGARTLVRETFPHLFMFYPNVNE